MEMNLKDGSKVGARHWKLTRKVNHMNKHETVKAFLDTMERVGDVRVGYLASDKDHAPSRWWCDSVRNEDVAHSQERDLWLSFQYNSDSCYYGALNVNMKNGEMTNAVGEVIGTMDEDIARMLIPFYNKYYLDKWADWYKTDKVEDDVLGIHDEFNTFVMGDRCVDGTTGYSFPNDEGVVLRNASTGLDNIDIH